MDKLKDIGTRMVAVFGADGLKVVSGGAVLGVGVVKSVALAGLMGVFTVTQKLCMAVLDDGKIDADELNEAFGGKRGE